MSGTPTRPSATPTPPEAETASGRILSLLHRRPVVTMGALLLAGMALTLWHLSRLSARLVDTAALQGTSLYADALAEFRTLYTSEVVARLHDSTVLITHDYKDHGGAIPLPATLSMELGRAIGAKGTGMQVRLYSQYPFPWRKDVGGPHDSFERDALEQLTARPQEPYYRLEEKDGHVYLRYATADLMRPTCVACHNSHPDSPKRDWKVGDVRGVLAVTRPLDPLRASTRAGLRDTLLLMAAMTTAGLALFGVVLGGLRRTAAALEGRMDELKKSETRIRLINEQLQVAHDEALAANRAKSEFLATMSHELRTPLNHILGYSEMLKDEVRDRGQADLAADLEKIHGAGTDLLALVNDILDLARIESGSMAVELSDFDVPTVVDEVVTAAQPLAQKNGNTLEVSIGAGVGVMHGDVKKIRQSLLNLLSNACKFTEGGKVVLAVTRRVDGGAEWIDFQVKDTGVGIPKEHLERLFRSFSMVDASTTRKQGGTGLGLVISRRFSQMLGGDISVESEVARGSTFTIRVPAKAKVEPPNA
ncbi:MAG: ATP-binding protein [Acidobacteriota bacterium]